MTGTCVDDTLHTNSEEFFKLSIRASDVSDSKDPQFNKFTFAGVYFDASEGK